MSKKQNSKTGADPNEVQTSKIQEIKTPEKIQEDIVLEVESGFVLPRLEVELSYAKNLAHRIVSSKLGEYEKIVVSHKDFVLMNSEGLIDFESKTLKESSQKLVIDSSPGCVSGTFTTIPDSEGAE